MLSRVREIMASRPITYRVPSSVNEVVKVLIKNNITGLPLVDSAKKYAGIISRRDIFENPQESQTAMVMRQAKPVHPDDTIEAAAQEMLRQKRRHVAVVGDDGTVVGILTPQNFLPAVAEKFGSMKVKDLNDLGGNPVWEETPVAVVSLTMRMSKTYACLAVDAGGKFTGLVTDRDLFDKIDLRSRIQVSESGIADDEDPWNWEGIRNVVTYMIVRNNIQLPEVPVKNIMIRNPVSTNTNESLSVVAKKMLDGNYNQLPVFRATSDLAGMVFDIELLKVFL
ncbi:MAG TPA: CBS domain-containing protein [Thermoplasmataceae archaeon]|nr:CBS domain-containing protein [Thermoplasmataceae archaeon]